MRVAVIVASMRRSREMGQLLHHLGVQSKKPDIIVLSVTCYEDLPPDLPKDILVIIGSPGSCVQRNRGIDAVATLCDVVVFFDDDFIPCQTALADIAALFDKERRIVGITGLVLRDGARGREVSYDDALGILATYAPPAPNMIKTWPRYGLYGCNMAFRTSVIGDVRFDENLVRYGWQEDIDFAARLRTHGHLVKTNAFAGVHLGVSKARSSGIMLGYSQMVNPVYLVRKGTMPAPMAAKLMLKNFVSNHVKAIRPEPLIDRRGRAKGNWRGILDILCGRASPRRILHFTGAGRS